jgi:hypothetical protein
VCVCVCVCVCNKHPQHSQDLTEFLLINTEVSTLPTRAISQSIIKNVYIHKCNIDQLHSLPFYRSYIHNVTLSSTRVEHIRAGVLVADGRFIQHIHMMKCTVNVLDTNSNLYLNTTRLCAHENSINCNVCATVDSWTQLSKYNMCGNKNTCADGKREIDRLHCDNKNNNDTSGSNKIIMMNHMLFLVMTLILCRFLY